MRFESRDSTGSAANDQDFKVAINSTFRALKSNMTLSTQAARENAKAGRTHKRATHLFMSGAAHLNHAENMYERYLQ